MGSRDKSKNSRDIKIAENKIVLSERLNQRAYSYYSSTEQVALEQRTAPMRLNRLFAAALLSSSSFLVMGAPASAVGPCVPAVPANGQTVTCSGTDTAAQRFVGDNLTVNADQTFNQNTSGNSIGQTRVNSGLYIAGSGGTIRHSGTIRTGEVAEGGGGPYGQHHGLFILGGAGDAYAENAASGSITTTVRDSNGIEVSATSGTSSAINRGTIQTNEVGSYGASATNANNAVAQNLGSITTLGARGHGVVTSSSGGAATSSNSGTISISGDTTGGLVSFGQTTSSTTNESTGIINVLGAGATTGLLSSTNDFTGTSTATNNGTINLRGVNGPTVNGYANIGVVAAGGNATATNAAGATITDTGNQEGSRGLIATTSRVNPFNGTGVRPDVNNLTASANNQGAITLLGSGSVGVIAASESGTAAVTNGGTISITGDTASGMSVNGATVHATNTGTINVTAATNGMMVLFSNTVGIRATSSSQDTTTVTNSGTITATGQGAIGIFAGGPITNVTNEAAGTISGSVAIGIEQAGIANVNNAGTLNGNIIGGIGKFRSALTDTLSITNTGTINGQINSHSFYNTSIVNNGGTVGDGTYAIFTGLGSNSVTINGTGNVIRGVIADRAANVMDRSTLTFQQTDTLTLDDGDTNNVAVQNFTSINFNSGTTNFAGTSINSPVADMAVNAGAVLGTTSSRFSIAAKSVTISGKGETRGTLQAPAGSTIQISGDTTFEAGGRFRVGVASDTSSGYLNGGQGKITFNPGSEIYADVTRGIQLTEGAPGIKIAGVVPGEGSIVDNNPGGVKVYDNTVIYRFTSEVRNTNELYLIAKRELRAVAATTQKAGRANAVSIAAAIDIFIDQAATDNVIVRYLAQFPVEQQEQKLFELVKDSLPSESGASGSSTVASTDMVLDLIMDRLSGGGFTVVDNGAPQTGVAAGEQILGGPGNWALWGRAGASFAEYEPAGVNGFDSDTYAISLGLDGDVSDALRMGAAFFYSDTKVDENGTNPNTAQDIEGYGVLLYGTYRPADFYVADFYVNATLGLGVNAYDSQRRAAGGVNKADYEGTQFMSRIEVGKVFTQGAWDVSPHVGLRFNKVAIDGYTETGPLPTSVNRQSLTSLRGVLGVSGRYTHALDNGGKLIPEAYIRGLQELAGPADAITGSIVGGGTFISQTTERDKTSFATGLGLTYEMDDQLSVRFLYDGEFQSDYREHSITAAIRFQF